MTAPNNDLIRNAERLDTASVTFPSFPFVDDATTESGEPGGIFQTVWWWFYAYNNATGVHISTINSNAGDAPSGDGFPTPSPYGSLDTVLNVYSATARYPSMGSLSLVAHNDNAPTGGGRKYSEVTFNITMGLYYFVQVGTPGSGYKGNVHGSYTGLPNSLPAPISGPFAQFIDVATTELHVDCKPGFPVPIQMPSGVQPGDQLVAFINGAFPDFVTYPPGWKGTLSTGLWTKTADGSEDGAVLNWTTQDRTEIFNDSFTLPVIAHVLCYRFVVPYASEFRFFGAGSAGASSLTLSRIPPGRVTPTGSDGLVASTHLRVECAFGGGYNDVFDLNSGVELTDIVWSGGPIDRTGTDGVTDSSVHIGSPGCIGQSVADVEYNYGPPFAVYATNNAVTGTGGAQDTGIDVYTAQYNFPGYSAPVAYWGINASTPT
jgi:hypothetical protein